MQTLLRTTTPTVFLAVFAGPALAIDPVFQDDGAAFRGYDPIAYFTEDGPVKGSPENSFSYQGAIRQFASAENRDTFAADPEKYTPDYGGYCAWAVSQGHIAPFDPGAWSIRDGRLYLNYSKTLRAQWALDKDGNIAAAARNWPGLRDGS